MEVAIEKFIDLRWVDARFLVSGRYGCLGKDSIAVEPRIACQLTPERLQIAALIFLFESSPGRLDIFDLHDLLEEQHDNDAILDIERRELFHELIGFGLYGPTFATCRRCIGTGFRDLGLDRPHRLRRS